MIALIQYILLGIMQGVTEPIPVSSSGHVLILKTILERFKQNVDIDFSTLATITNLGSLVAIVIIFRKDNINLVKSFFTYLFKKEKRIKLEEEKEQETINESSSFNIESFLEGMKNKGQELKDEYNYCWKIVLATIPAGLLGIVATKFNLLNKLEENVKFIGLTLLITAVFLYLIKDFKGKKDQKQISFKDAMIIGLYQMIAIIPGISRSGATIVGGMFQGLKRETAFNFSFILYIPISIATSILGIKDLLELSTSANTLILYTISALLAGIFTYICTKWFAKIVKEGKLIYFSAYCLIVGLLVIILL